jgi:hypothetical protein
MKKLACILLLPIISMDFEFANIQNKNEDAKNDILIVSSLSQSASRRLNHCHDLRLAD